MLLCDWNRSYCSPSSSPICFFFVFCAVEYVIEVPQVMNECLTISSGKSRQAYFTPRRNEKSGNEIAPSVDTDRVKKLVT